MRFVSRWHAVHHERANALCLRDRAVLVSQQESLEVDNFLTQLGNSGGKGVILGGEKFNLVLEVGQPLLLSLSALESRNSENG
jgi:hypothetical protein